MPCGTPASGVTSTSADPVAARRSPTIRAGTWPMSELPDVATLSGMLDSTGYLTDESLATALFLALRLGQPILLEGEPGVGKTEAAKSLATALDTPLIRLQCYEGLDAAEALYEWNYPRQLLAIRAAETRGARLDENEMFGDEY